MPQTLAPVDQRSGLTASELLRGRRRCVSDITPIELERWLLQERLATVGDDGRLTATALGLELGGALHD